MKLIIEISEKIYDTIMSYEKLTKEEMSAVVLRIYQGIPIIEECQTESLISQYQRHNIMEHTERMKPDTAFSIIWDRSQHCKETEEAIKALKQEIRPHGEWIPCKSTRTGQVTNIDYKCSKCSHHRERPMPYCEICGAKMKRSEKK